MAYKIEYILLIGILAFLLYHLLGSCNCNDGFSVGGCIQGIDSCSNKKVDEKLKNTPCNQLYEQNQFDEKKKTKCIVDMNDASNCVPTDILCDSDPINPHGFEPIIIDDIKTRGKSNEYYINPNEILIILKSNGPQTLEINDGGTVFLYICGNIYIESGATLNINNFAVNYNDGKLPLSAATIINNGKLNISNHLGTYIFYGIETKNISKLTNNGIITFRGTNQGSKKSQKSEMGTSLVTYDTIDITGDGGGEIIYNNAGISYNNINIDNNTQTFNKCTIVSNHDILSFNKSLTLNMSSFNINLGMTILAPAKITISESYMYSMYVDKQDNYFTSDNMTITKSNMMFYLQLNIKNITMDQSNLTVMNKANSDTLTLQNSNLTVMNKANINSDTLTLQNSNLIIDKGWSGIIDKSNITIDNTSSIIVK